MRQCLGREGPFVFMSGFFVCCLLSISQEGPFVYMSLVGTVETSEGPLAELCEFNFSFQIL